MRWSSIDKLWKDRLGKTSEGDVSWKTEQWAVPGEGPLEVRMCTRKGFPLSKYSGPEAPRTSIVLHLTAGYGHFQGLMGSADHNSASAHFLLGRCGTPYCLVPTERTANHAGYWNDNSIGIEIDNIVNLFKRGNNLVSCYSAGKDVYCTLDDKDVYLEKDYLGLKYWSTLTENQYVNLGKLLKALCFKHHIPRILLPEPQRWQPFDRNARKTYAGICTHLNLAPKDRFDIGPYIDWPKVIQYAGLTEADCFHPPASVMDTWKDSTGGKMAKAAPAGDEPKADEPKPAPAGGGAKKPAPSGGGTKPQPPVGADTLPAPVMIDNHTLRVRVGKHAGRICFSVKQPGDPLPTSPDAKDAPAAKAPGKRDDFIRECMNFLGAPYKSGSKKPSEGIDGANMIGMAMQRVGLFKSEEETPADAEHLSALWHTISGNPKEPPAEILPGDVVWFGKGDHDNDPTQHPMVYLGGGRALGPIPDGGPENGAVQVIAVDKVPETFAGWMHVSDFGTETKHTEHPGEPPKPGEKLTSALLPAGPSDRYDALKAMVERAGGKWEDGKGKVNLVGVKNMHERCMVSPQTDGWNDSLFAAFLDEGGHKMCLDLRASLNPGHDKDKVETWQLWEGSWKFKLGTGDSVKNKALQPEGKVKGWLDDGGWGSPRVLDPEAESQDHSRPGAPKPKDEKPPAPKPVAKSDAKPAPTDNAFVFDAASKKTSLKFGMRMMRALIDWELRQEDGGLKGCVYSTNGVVTPYKAHVPGVAIQEWPDLGQAMKIDPVKKVTVAGREYGVWHAFGMEWGATDATNCCNSQFAALFASLPDGKMRIKRGSGVLEVDLVKNTPADDIKDHPKDNPKKAIGFAEAFARCWIGGGSCTLKTNDGKKLFRDFSQSSPVWAMRYLQIGEAVGRWGDEKALRDVRIGDSGQWTSHNWLVGDLRYEVRLKGKAPVYCDQSDFVHGDQPELKAINAPGGYKLSKKDCEWVEANEGLFLERLKNFFAAKHLELDGKDYEVQKITPVQVRVFSANAVVHGDAATMNGKIWHKGASGWTVDAGATKTSQMNLGISRPWVSFASQRHNNYGGWGFARWFDNAGGAEFKPEAGVDPRLSTPPPVDQGPPKPDGWELPPQGQWTNDAHGQKCDPVNVYAFGAFAALEKALLAAGWTRAAANNMVNNVKYIGDAVEWGEVKAQDAYAQLLNRIPGVHVPEMKVPEDDEKVVASMPVSQQSLDGKPFEAAYEFANNPVGGRHHIRIFDSGRQDAKGRAVWSIAATQDIGIMFDPKRPEQGFMNHRCASNTDGERDFLANALKSAGAQIESGGPIDYGAKNQYGYGPGDSKVVKATLGAANG
jgi:N-acetyl-anhydromuramyl-L-alanine amidase AmpD